MTDNDQPVRPEGPGAPDPQNPPSHDDPTIAFGQPAPQAEQQDPAAGQPAAPQDPQAGQPPQAPHGEQQDLPPYARQPEPPHGDPSVSFGQPAAPTPPAEQPAPQAEQQDPAAGQQPAQDPYAAPSAPQADPYAAPSAPQPGGAPDVPQSPTFPWAAPGQQAPGGQTPPSHDDPAISFGGPAASQDPQRGQAPEPSAPQGGGQDLPPYARQPEQPAPGGEAPDAAPGGSAPENPYAAPQPPQDAPTVAFGDVPPAPGGSAPHDAPTVAFGAAQGDEQPTQVLGQQANGYGQPPAGSYGAPGQPDQGSPYGAPPQAPPPGGYGTPPGGPGGPGGYGNPPGGPTPPKKKGMPWWVWLLIIVGGLAVIGGGVFGAIAISQTFTTPTPNPEPGPVEPGDDAADDAAEAGEEAGGEPATEAAEESADDGGQTDPSTGGGPYELTDTVPFSSQPVWQFPVPSGWDVTAADEEGWNAAASPDGAQCVFSSYQGVWMQGDQNASTDFSATEGDFPVILQALEITDADVQSGLGYASIDSPEGAIDFQVYEVSHTMTSDGEQVDLDERFYVRSMMDANSTMFLRVSCGSDGLTDDIVSQTLDAASITY
ncbi:hypothetical protein [Microbacterium sp. gxy059]|uniref:hypothetical protein n=1 Tax=Microbacterium sp. gxy059 TaxID=2957199 RepID=UPI003D957E8D